MQKNDRTKLLSIFEKLKSNYLAGTNTFLKVKMVLKLSKVFQFSLILRRN